jgi:uncharacterized protein YgiM (DUF1202 family)
MKISSWLIFCSLCTSLLAQQPAPPPPAAAPAANPVATNPAAANAGETTPTPPAKTEKKAKKSKAKKAPVIELQTSPLSAGPAVVVASNVNMRGQAKLKSEVVGRLNKGQQVTVLEQVNLKNSAADEPSAWAKILMPAGSHVWVNTMFINASNKTVLPRKLNLRSGPGENYSVLGVMARGDALKEISTKGDWTQVEAPADAYAFVAARYLSQETTALAAAPVTEPTPTTTTIAEEPKVAATATDTAVVADPAATTNTVAAATNAIASATLPDLPIDEPPPKRVVQREGIVRGTISIQAPTHFELANPENGRTINYLYTTSPRLDLREYKGLRIVVTGEEGLDERWRNTPVITIQKIHVVE